MSNYRLFESLLRDKQNTVYEITCNYRCLPSIVKFADDFLITMRSIRKTKSWCIREGAANIVETPYNLPDIYDVISNSSDKYSDWFVLARWNKQVNQISRYLKSKGIPVDNFKQRDKTYEELRTTIAANTVKVLTIHSAKGLEAKNVIVVGGTVKKEEERRICYVGATRAKDNLIWMSAFGNPKVVEAKNEELIKRSEKEQRKKDMMSWG